MPEVFDPGIFSITPVTWSSVYYQQYSVSNPEVTAGAAESPGRKKRWSEVEDVVGVATL